MGSALEYLYCGRCSRAYWPEKGDDDGVVDGNERKNEPR